MATNGEDVTSHEHETGNKSVNAFFWNQPLNPLQAGFDRRFRKKLSSGGAQIQADLKNLVPDTNLVVTYARYGKDVPPRDMAVFGLPRQVEKYSAKVLGVVNVPRIPPFEEMDADFLQQILDQPEGSDPTNLVQLARERLHSPALTLGYPEMALVGCNLILLLEGEDEQTKPKSAYLIGLEQSHPQVAVDGLFFQNLYNLIKPQILSTLVIKNRVRRDVVVPDNVFKGSPLSHHLIEASKEMYELGLYPPPFPLKRVVSAEKQRLYELMLGITGLSYGNTSARALGELTQYGKFLMSQSGVPKDSLTDAQVLIAMGVDPEEPIMQIAAREGIEYNESTRISVDAIEAQLLYDAFPDVNVTSHGHVWLLDSNTGKPLKPDSQAVPIGNDMFVTFTDEQFPCGGVELGRAAVNATRVSPSPNRTIILEKRHGMVALGKNYPELFDRLRQLKQAGLITSQIPQD